MALLGTLKVNEEIAEESSPRLATYITTTIPRDIVLAPVLRPGFWHRRVVGSLGEALEKSQASSSLGSSLVQLLSKSSWPIEQTQTYL